MNPEDKHTHNFKDLVDQLLSSPAFKARYTAARVKQSWRQLMAENAMHYTSGLRYNKGVLYVHITSAALRDELNRGKQLIIDLINKDLGENLLKDIRFL